MASPGFRFKRFSVAQEGVTHPVGTDGVLLGAWADVAGATRILDVGTGSGVIALMLAQRTERRPNVRIEAVDMHGDSVRRAQENFRHSPWSQRLYVHEMRVQELARQMPASFDLIVSNPPFFSENTVAPDETRRLGRHTATLPPGELLAAVRQLLAPDGRFAVVLPVREGRRLCEMAVPIGLYWTKIVEVYGRRDKPLERLLIQFETNPYPFQRSTFLIYETGNEYAADYKGLTADFYL